MAVAASYGQLRAAAEQRPTEQHAAGGARPNSAIERPLRRFPIDRYGSQAVPDDVLLSAETSLRRTTSIVLAAGVTAGRPCPPHIIVREEVTPEGSQTVSRSFIKSGWPLCLRRDAGAFTFCRIGRWHSSRKQKPPQWLMMPTRVPGNGEWVGVYPR